MLMNIPGMGKASVGLCRVMHGLVRAHRDRLEKDLGMTREELDRFMGYISQLAVNVYIKVPLTLTLGLAAQQVDRKGRAERTSALTQQCCGMCAGPYHSPVLSAQMPVQGHALPQP